MVSRRGLLLGAMCLVASPAIVRAESLMTISPLKPDFWMAPSEKLEISNWVAGWWAPMGKGDELSTNNEKPLPRYQDVLPEQVPTIVRLSNKGVYVVHLPC